MQKLYTAADLPEAYLLAQLLARAGIEARVLNEHAQGGLGEIPFTHAWPEVWLMDDADVPRAQRVLETYTCTSADDVPRRCHGCGEENPGTFETCWRCGTSQAS